MLQLRIEHTDGTTSLLQGDSYSDTQTYDEQWRASITVSREDWVAVLPSVDDVEDEFYVDQNGTVIFGGRIKDHSRNGPTVTVQIGSFETDGRDAEPTGTDGPRSSYVGVSDSDIVGDAVDDIPTLSRGQIDQLVTGLDFRAPRSSQAKKIRKVREATGGAVVYRPDQSVDYLSRLGTDRTVTLSPSNQNVIGDFGVLINSTDKVTHLKGLGHGKGSYQLEVDEVAPSYQAGDRQVWRKYKNQEITFETEMREVLSRRIQEYDGEPTHIEIQTTLAGLDVSLGDTFEVENQAENISSQRLKVVELERLIEPGGTTYEVILSNRLLTRDATQEAKSDRQTVSSVTEAYEGTATVLTSSGGRQMVDNGLPWQDTVYYPSDVKDEITLQLRVLGLPYRTYSKGGAAGGGLLTTTASGGTDSDTTKSGGSSTVTSASGGTDTDTTASGGSSTVTSASGGTNTDTTASGGSSTVTSASGGTNTDTTASGGSSTVTSASGGTDTDTTVSGGSYSDTETAIGNNPRNVVEGTGDDVRSIVDTNGDWARIGLGPIIDVGADYSHGFVGFTATGSDAIIEVRLRDSSTTSVGDTTGDFSPNVSGTAIAGQGFVRTSVESAAGDSHSHACDEAQAGNSVLPIPTDWGYVDVDYKTSRDPSCNLHIWYYLIGNHTHDLNLSISGHQHEFDWLHDHSVSVPSHVHEFDWLHDHSVDISSHVHQFDWLHDHSVDIPSHVHQFDWLHDHSVDIPSHVHQFDWKHDHTIDTSDHTHPPEAGIIQDFGGTTYYPSNVSVFVNGTDLGVSLGDGTGRFSQTVSIPKGTLEAGFNDVRITTDTLGSINATLGADVFRQMSPDS